MFTFPFAAVKVFRAVLCATVQAICAVIALTTGLAHADDYADVNVLVRAGKLAEALAKADQYIASKPRDPQMRFIKGVIQTESGKPAEAVSTFTQITQDYPELPEPYNNLAVLYAGQSQFDKARAALEMAIRTNPSYATAHENLGDVYAKLASQAYSKALQLDGTNTGVQPKLALIRTLFSPDPKGLRTGSAAPSSGPVAISPAMPSRASAPSSVTSSSPATAPIPAATAPAAALPATTPSAKGAPAGSVGSDSASGSALDKDVENAVRAWATAWSNKDMTGYLGSYGKDFDPPGAASRKSWEEDRRARIMGKSRINVKLADLAVTVEGTKATVKFKQTYSADTLNVSSRKTLNLVKTADKWQIVRESTG